MATTIKLKNSVTTTNAPSSLVQGEVAINITDKKVWVGNAATTPIQLLGDGGSASFTSIAFGAGTVSNPSITFTGDTNTGIYSPAADTIAFTEGGVESMRIDSSGNVGIGTANPQQKLVISNSGAAGLEISPTAIASSPCFISYNRSSSAYTQLTSLALQHVWQNSGTEVMRIDSSGNVGIGTSSVGIFGQSAGRLLNVVASSNYAFLQLQGASGNGGAIDFGDTSVRHAEIASLSGSALAFYTNPTNSGNGLTERMRIDSSGNVGIGTSSPSQKLHLSNASGNTFLQVSSGSNNIYYGWENSRSVASVQSNTAITFDTGGSYTERMRINSSGNISIGASSGNGKLSVQDSSAALQEIFTNSGTNYAALEVRNTGSSVYIGKDNSAGSSFGSGTAYASCVWSGGAYPLVFFTTGTERMRITSGGYFKASNTGTYQNSTGAFHEFYSNGQTTEVLFIKSDNASYTGDAVFVDVNRNTTNNSFYAINYYNRAANAYKFRVADSGNVTNTNGSYGTISDIKNKENIVDATPKLDKIKQLQVRNFNFKGDDLKQIGFIAQEFEQVFPSMVEEHHDKDADGNDLGTTTKSIKTSVLVPILVKAIQEQQTMIVELTNRIKKLEGV